MNKVELFFDRLAPSWDSKESHSTEEKINLLQKIGIKKVDKVLDVACGTGVITSLLHDISCNNIIGIDISNEMILRATHKYKDADWATFIHSDLMNYQPEEPFDVAVIYNAYPHFENPHELAQKLHSLLCDDGKVAILHSLSREELAQHHAGHASEVSRIINAPEEEAKSFEPYFEMALSEETNHSYTLILKKKQI